MHAPRVEHHALMFTAVTRARMKQHRSSHDGTIDAEHHVPVVRSNWVPSRGPDEGLEEEGEHHVHEILLLDRFEEVFSPHSLHVQEIGSLKHGYRSERVICDGQVVEQVIDGVAGQIQITTSSLSHRRPWEPPRQKEWTTVHRVHILTRQIEWNVGRKVRPRRNRLLQDQPIQLLQVPGEHGQLVLVEGEMQLRLLADASLQLVGCDLERTQTSRDLPFLVQHILVQKRCQSSILEEFLLAQPWTVHALGMLRQERRPLLPARAHSLPSRACLPLGVRRGNIWLLELLVGGPVLLPQVDGKAATVWKPHPRTHAQVVVQIRLELGRTAAHLGSL
mmetsp:Transcript_19987/g.63579  ORF Transcript_19987/g.63579 Transcript_19987/m.63579 type:complete len:334 (-) Transcript_19987:1130-2131(-)